MRLRIFIYFLVIILARGQFFADVVSNTARQLTNELVNVPFVQFATHTSGELIAETVEALSSIPIAAARYLGISNFPTLITNSNLVDAGNIIAEFDLGVGNEDAKLHITQLIEKYGYPVETHKIATPDGYLLSIHRIPRDGPKIFLMHGLVGSSDDYVIAGPESGLAYLLADEGYDVWMGNARGNKHSRRHVSFDPSEALFWDFSWHEIGYYDLPAMIDYILESTGKKTLQYIGHSQGTTAFFVMVSERPEYNKKISFMIALSPVAFMTNVKAPIVRLLAPGGVFYHWLFKSLGLHELLPDNALVKLLKNIICGINPLSEILCTNVMFLFCGFNLSQLNVTNLPVFYGHTPSGSSIKQIVHYGQEVISGDFRKFDYGATENLERYGSEVPPSYQLENIQVPVSLFYSDADWLAHPKDVELLYNKLGNAVDIHKIPYENFNHIDFILAKDFKILVYDRLHKLLRYFISD